MNARAAILDRVRLAQRTGRVPADTAPVRPNAAVRAAGPSEAVDLLARFSEELTALGVVVHVEESPEAVRGRLAEIVTGHRVLAWDAVQLPYDAGRLLRDAATGSSPREVQAAADIGVTGCDAAVAETGSLVLLSGQGKPRSASLLPPVHVALVKPGDLRFGMGEVFQERAKEIAAASCCTFVTGPSRTADIELTLTLGVHGPGRVIVIIGP